MEDFLREYLLSASAVLLDELHPIWVKSQSLEDEAKLQCAMAALIFLSSGIDPR